MTTSDGFNRRQALAGLTAAGIGVPLLAACGSDTATDTGGDAATTGSTPGGTTGSSQALGATGDIPEGSGTIFKEAEVVVTQPSAGEFKAFSAICTHQGCLVSEVTTTIDCACHFSKFSITDGSVVEGPANAPLPEKQITVEGDEITLA